MTKRELLIKNINSLLAEKSNLYLQALQKALIRERSAHERVNIKTNRQRRRKNSKSNL